MRRCPGLILIAVLLAATARADVAITLHAAARIDAGSALTIGDVATISGNPAVGLLRLDTATDEPGRLTINVADVQRALQSHGYSRADATVRGDTCVVILREATTPGPPEPATRAIASNMPAPTGRTVQDHIRAAIERTLSITGDALRLRFDPADADTLGRATAGLTVDVHATGLSRRTPVRATLYAPDGSIEVLRVRVGVQILREVARVSRALPRGTALRSADFTVSNEWLSPDEPHLEPTLAISQKLRRSVKLGDRLTDASVEPPVVIQRGDIVMVHVISGAVVLRQESRAVESGRVGHRIRLEPIAGGQPFQAVVEGPGRAVIMTGPRLNLEDA